MVVRDITNLDLAYMIYQSATHPTQLAVFINLTVIENLPLLVTDLKILKWDR
jgi:hypothetical protein